jgi:membrane-bound metal-dependent hydrolase YbcI (DUF457 family)
MPSSVGHGLAGIAAGWAIARPAANRRALIVQSAILAAAAAAPDLDLLIDRHRAEAHSLGVAALVATVAALMRWPVASTRARIWWAVAAAWATHPLLDSLAVDTTAPIGIMAFWPLSRAYVETGLGVFAPIWRAPITMRMIRHDVLAIIAEMALLVPLCAMVGLGRRARPKPVQYE